MKSGGPADEADLVRRCLARDEDAWAALVERYAGYLYALAVRGFRFTPQEAEDVVQDTFAQVFEHLSEYRSTGPLAAWMGTIARNVARQRLRTRARHPEAVLPDEAVDTAQQQALDTIERALLVNEALTRLEPPCDDILRRFFILEQKYGEIASVLQVPPGTVASRIARCLVRLRKIVQDSGGGMEERGELRHLSK
jgi:RNA polymerase sigma-70 factor (ECF subfamily)